MRIGLLLLSLVATQCDAVLSPVKLFVHDLYKGVTEAKHFTSLKVVRYKEQQLHSSGRFYKTVLKEYVVVSGDNFTSMISTEEWPPKLQKTWHVPPSETATSKCFEYVKGLNESASLLSYGKIGVALRDYVCATNHVFLATMAQHRVSVDNPHVMYRAVCFTNARSPYCSRYNKTSLEFLQAEAIPETEFFVADPRSESVMDGGTTNYMTSKDPLNSTNSFIWTFSLSPDFGMRPSVRTGKYHLAGDVEFIGTIPSPWLDPNDYSGSMPGYEEEGRYIFFNEDAEEDQHCNPGRRFPRVARIISIDIGYPLSSQVGLPGPTVHNRSAYSSFQKARLKCHAEGELLEFDRLRSITFDNRTTTVFGLFTRGNDDGVTASAICAYTLLDIRYIFIHGSRTGKKYNYAQHKDTPTAQWIRKSLGDANTARPENLLPEGATKEEMEKEAERLQQHYLSYDPIEPRGGAAIFVKLKRLEHLQALSYKYYDEGLKKNSFVVVLYTTHIVRLESGKERRHLWKVNYFPPPKNNKNKKEAGKILWPSREELLPIYSAEGERKKSFNEKILQMQLVNYHVPYLLLLTESNVLAVKLTHCSQFHDYDSCEAKCNPFCTWLHRRYMVPYQCPANQEGVQCVLNNSTIIPSVDLKTVFEDDECQDEPMYFENQFGMTSDGCRTGVDIEGA